MFTFTLLYNTNSSSPDYTIHNWPVPYTNQCHLDAIKETHDIHQLPAYNIKGDHIKPSNYEDKLAGAITRVYFSIVHYLIKERHISSALVKDISIIHPPTTIAPTSLKNVLHPPKKKKAT